VVVSLKCTGIRHWTDRFLDAEKFLITGLSGAGQTSVKQAFCLKQERQTKWHFIPARSQFMQGILSSGGVAMYLSFSNQKQVKTKAVNRKPAAP
jgi:hypothetical protein